MTKSKQEVTPSYGSIFRAIEARVKAAKFGPEFLATQITLTGACDFQPLYIRVEDGLAEIAPYEYHNADFYIDSDADAMAAVLNGKKTIYDAVREGSVTVNGVADKAIVFINDFFG